ncbi:SPOR domain-containing protein [Phenylobacterium sp.]|uniref:SPOR domain-containing protein n=1 Tax=Phenylobacterium sp. TaxID=1871053 RepID=UPI003D2D7E87
MALAFVLAAAPALAAPADLPAWLAANTDIPAAQVVIPGPEHVYSLEPLGARTPAGEVIALVRAEPLAADWGASRGFQSWDAHILFDCAAGRLREIRAATYPGRNRKGAPTSERTGADWTKPAPDQPAARLLAAACDSTFVWALRNTGQRAALALAQLPPPVLPARGYALQLARGSSQEGAQRALVAARKTLGPLAQGLADTTEVTAMPAGPRYTSRLAGFPDLAAAQSACNTLRKAGHDCFPWQPGAEPTVPAAAAIPTSGFVVQLAQGPSEDGAQRAAKAARKALDPAGRRLTAVTRTTQVEGDQPHYTALLAGFQTAGEAARACAALTRAGQSCFARPADDNAD